MNGLNVLRDRRPLDHLRPRICRRALEPCDIFAVADDQAVFYHVKRSTHSSQLSHLFNQGMNAIEIIKVEPESVEKLFRVIESGVADQAARAALIAPVKEQKLKVVFGVITHKDPSVKC